MAELQSILRLNELPGNATNGEALAWVNRMRRVVDHWESLPGFAERPMTPERRQGAHDELDDVERSIRRNMEVPKSA
jgi:hypothetical protein